MFSQSHKMNNQQGKDPIDETNIKLPRWNPEGTDAQAVARAVNGGTLDLSVPAYNRFLESNQTIKHKYGHNLVKGARNLRSNITRLIKRINLYKANKVDGKTGNPIEFGSSFLKKGNFPKRPDIVGDIPKDQLEANEGQPFNPGRDGEYENAVQEERRNIFDFENDSTDSEFEFDSEDDDDDGSLSVVDTTDIRRPLIIDEDNQRPDPEEQLSEYEEDMPTKKKSPRNQDAVSYALLKPVVIVMEGNDPEYASYNRTHSRDILGIRVDIPSGVHPTAFSARVSSCKQKIEFTTTAIQSRYDAVHTIGDKLADCKYGRNIIMAFDKVLKQDWSRVVGTEKIPADVNTWTVSLPLKIEKRPINPCKDWIPTPPGFNGFLNVVEDDHAVYWSAFYMVEEAPNLVNPMSSLGGLVDVSFQKRSNPMGFREMQQARMANMNLFSSRREGGIPRSVDHRHRGGRHSDMSIDSTLDDDTSIAPPPEDERARWARWEAKKKARDARAARSATAAREGAEEDAEREAEEERAYRASRKPNPTYDSKPAARSPQAQASQTNTERYGSYQPRRSKRDKSKTTGGGRTQYDHRKREEDYSYETITVDKDGNSFQKSRSGRSLT